MPSRRPSRLFAVAALAAVLPLSACGGSGTSRSSTCSGGTCTVNLTGEQKFEVDGTDGFERDLRVGPIEADAVTLSMSGAQVRLRPGQTTRLDEVPVEVTKLSGRNVSLRVAATEVGEDSDGRRKKKSR